LKNNLRKVVAIDGKDLPLDKVVHSTQLLAFCLTAKKPKMVVQFAVPG
jgi:hypothetical protein